MPEEKSGFFGPIDLHMWESPGWRYVAEQAERQAREKEALQRDIAIHGPLYVPGVGLRIPEHYKH